jgi:signal transduction histidine kinase
MTAPRRRILVVEDSRVQALRIQRLLEGGGYEVTVANDGVDGLERLRAARPDLIVCDVVMPRLDGYGLCRAVRSDPVTRDIPIVLLTERRSPSDIIRGLDQGADNFITKPCTDEYVLERVARIFEHLDLRAQGRLDMNVVMTVAGRRVAISADRQQILELLMSTLDDLERANHALEGKVRERTRALEALTRTLETQVRDRTERLLHAEKLAWMGQLLAGVAHELNNPLAVVMGHLQLFKRSTQDPASLKRADRMEAAVQRCADIVKGFIGMARGLPTRRDRIDLNEVVHDSVAMVTDLLRADGIEVSLVLTQDLPEVAGDAQQLQQVVVNLLTNAQQAMRDAPGPRRLSVASGTDARRHRVTLTVQDSGPGIAPEMTTRIFEPFVTTKAPGEYLGLGLALCDSIVKRHDGAIHADAPSGRGATFRVDLPAAATAAALAPDESSADGGILPRRVLVVDDQAAVRALVAEALRVDGHTVDTAVDYESALDWLAAGRYDLVLTDDALPGPLGHEVRALAKPVDVAALRRLVAGLRAVGAA